LPDYPDPVIPDPVLPDPVVPDPPANDPATAPPAKGRPDLRIGKVDGPLLGNNIYGSAARQSIKQTGGVGKKLTWQISVQNDANVADRIQLAGAKSAHGFKVKYISPTGVDITKQVVGGKFRTPQLAAGGSYRVKVLVTVTRAAKPGRVFTGQVEGSSARTPTRTDAVAFVAKRG
jgi:hypothetical protein